MEGVDRDHVPETGDPREIHLQLENDHEKETEVEIDRLLLRKDRPRHQLILEVDGQDHEIR